ncbi:MAG: amidohydrolase family protein, partial [Clostridia bacterium]|nr:amidohydrolase family protein [Clostridia bacterium]
MENKVKSEKNRKIIDVHTHVFPDKIALRTVDNVANYYSIHMSGNGTLFGLLDGAETLDARFVISNAALKAENVRRGNDFLIECTKSLPKRLIYLGSVHPDMEEKEMCKELEYIKENDGRGIKLHPDFQHFKIEDPMMFSVYKEAERLGLPILFHVGDENTVNSTPKAVRFVADKFPDLEIIAAHMGGYMAWDDAEEYLIGSRVYMDTSDALLVLSPERVYNMINRHSADRIMFGSDFPLKSTFDAYVEFDSLPLSDSQKEQIYYKTAEAVFKIK